MPMDSQDMAIIEQALREGMNSGTDYQKMLMYREVLSKLQQIPTATDPHFENGRTYTNPEELQQ